MLILWDTPPPISLREGVSQHASQHALGRTQKYTLDSRPHHRTTIHSHTYRQFRLPNEPQLRVLGLWEETGAPGGTHQLQGEPGTCLQSGDSDIHKALYALSSSFYEFMFTFQKYGKNSG